LAITVKPKVYILDEELGWTQQRNVQRTYQTDGVTAAVETNELGLRGPVYTGPSRQKRILILGDSFTAGFEVSNDELFSMIWDRARPDLEIVNAGVSGYSTVQEILRSRQLQSIVQPDLYMLFVYENDLNDNVMPFFPGLGPRPYVDENGHIHPTNWELYVPLLPPIPGKIWLYKNTLGFYLIHNWLWQFSIKKQESKPHPYVKQWSTAIPEDVKWKALEGLIATFAQGKKLVLVALPAREHVKSGDTDFSVRLQGLAERVGVQFVNLQLVLRPEHFYENDIHWNAAGHKAVASYLTSKISP